MPLIEYVSRRFSPESLDIIERANEIIDDYAEQGLVLTLRQLYYRFVSADIIPNEKREYDKLGDVISNGRLAGLIDWDAIEDRGRELRRNSHWEDPAHIIRDAAAAYGIDRWVTQGVRPEVWVEKQALEGVIGQACEPFDVAYFACKGYTSQSEMWRASRRFESYLRRGQLPVVIHLGDHDPSGIDMTRDIDDRLNETFRLQEFCGTRIPVRRIALNMDQIRRYSPPPNPAKLTDSRSGEYVKRFGESSWELDALEPSTLRDLIQSAIRAVINLGRYDEKVELERLGREQLKEVSERWKEIESLMGFTPTTPNVPVDVYELNEAEKAAKRAKEPAKTKAKKTTRTTTKGFVINSDGDIVDVVDPKRKPKKAKKRGKKR